MELKSHRAALFYRYRCSIVKHLPLSHLVVNLIATKILLYVC